MAGHVRRFPYRKILTETYMTKKSPRFVTDFKNEFMGRTPDDFAANLSQLMDRAVEFLRMCDRDLDFATNLLNSRDSQETRRVFIRTLPPYVEGSLNFLRIIVHLYPPLLKRLPADCSAHFLEPLIELRNRSTTKESIKKTFVGIGQVTGSHVPNDIMGEPGAQALIATFELRDSLMHPRSIDGFTVTEEQLATARAGQVWFLGKFASVFSPLKDVVKSM